MSNLCGVDLEAIKKLPAVMRFRYEMDMKDVCRLAVFGSYIAEYVDMIGKSFVTT